MLVFVLGKFLVSRKIHRAAEGTVGHCWGETVYTSDNVAPHNSLCSVCQGSCFQLLDLLETLIV